MNITQAKLKMEMFSSTLKIQNESNWPSVAFGALTACPQPGLVLLSPGHCPVPGSHGASLPCPHPGRARCCLHTCRPLPSPDLFQSPEMAPASCLPIHFSRLTSFKQTSFITGL